MPKKSTLYTLMGVIFLFMYLGDIVSGNMTVITALLAMVAVGFASFYLLVYLRKRFEISYVLPTNHLIVIIVVFYFLQTSLRSNVLVYHIILGFIIAFVFVFSSGSTIPGGGPSGIPGRNQKNSKKK